MKSSMIGLGLAMAALGEDCELYRKITNNVCADACLDAQIGICPRDIVVTTGGLQGGGCKDLGFTVAQGQTTQTAGPCGDLTFNEYAKPSSPTLKLSNRYNPKASNVTKLASFDGDLTYKWQDQNDPVMGGASVSSFRIDSDRGVGVFNGTCAIVPFLKAPGFAKITSVAAVFPDVSPYLNGGLELRLKSRAAYTGWKAGFGAKGVPRTSPFGGGSFKAVFELEAGEWQVVRIPFDQFSYDWSGFTGQCDTKDPDGTQHVCCGSEHPEVCPTATYLSTLTDLQLWAEGVEGDFTLEVDYLGVYM